MNPCEELSQSLGGLFQCAQINDRTRIRTPFLYPDGDVIDVFVAQKGGVTTVSDLGESLRWLRMQTASAKRTPNQKRLLDDVCLSLGVEQFRGMLMRRVGPGDSLAGIVTLVSQASLRVADLWFTMRNRAVESVADEIADFLTERNVLYDRAQKLVGRSGKTYSVDFHTRVPARSSLVQVLATGSKGSARGVAEHVVTMWYDLNHLRTTPDAPHLVSLFDDTTDVWSPEDFKLLSDLSEIARWSRPDEVEALLKAA